MTTAAIVSMTIILTGIWGGFACCLWHALRLERRKTARAQAIGGDQPAP